jgi:formylmethanofuran--tetrahydromethanopterin N-formyltransferase
MAHEAIVEDTYAEAFRSIYAEILVTARDRKWLDHAINAATGHASSTIMCDCEAGLDRYVGPGTKEPDATPDGRPGAILQFHMPRFRKDRVQALERALLARVSQNVLTCPTCSCFNQIDSDPFFKLGRKLAFFGDGHQFRGKRYNRPVWVVPILAGEFIIDRRFGFRDGLMGGNLWFFGETEDAALEAAERAHAAVAATPGVIAPFPGGIASSVGEKSRLPAGVNSVMEVIINGHELPSIEKATHAAIAAAKQTPGLLRISAGNYGGRLGKSFIYLHPASKPTTA